MIWLELDHGQRHRKKSKGLLSFRITSRESGVDAVDLRVNWDDGRVEKELRFTGVTEGVSQIGEVQWIPDCDGTEIVVVRGRLLRGKRCLAEFNGREKVVIHPRSSGDVTYVNQVRVRGGAVDFRPDYGAAPKDEAPSIRPLDWKVVPLQLVRRAVTAVRDDAAHSVSASLRIATPAGTAQTICIASAAEFAAGRESRCDAVLRFLPENDENNSRSEIISRSQFVLSITDGIVLIQPGSGTSPTFVDGKRLGQGHHLAIPPAGARVTAGLIGLELAVDVPIDTDRSAAAMHAEIAESIGTDRRGDLPPSAVRLRRLNNEPDLSYLWLRHWATIGSAQDCAIRLESVNPSHLARLFFVDGRYFLEPLMAGVPAEVSGESVATGAVRQLGQEERIQIGPIALAWSLGH